MVGHLIDPDENGSIADPTVRNALDHSWGRILAGVISESENKIAQSIKGLDLHVFKVYEIKSG